MNCVTVSSIIFRLSEARIACAIGASGLIAAMLAPVVAANDIVLEEVLVTATKRGEQALQDVPLSVQALTAEEIRGQVATDISDLAPQISSLVVQDLGPGDRKYIIRGVNSTATATVGVYYDEAVITARTKQDGGGRQASIELHDLSRLEVLKGPQGTLYGASSMSGTVRYVPNNPDSSQSEASIGGTWSDTYDGDDSSQMNVMFNIPIVEDVFALRFLGWITDESGWIDNILLNTEDINSNNVGGFKLAAEWRVDDDLTITAWGLGQDREVGGTSREMPEIQKQFADNQKKYQTELSSVGFGIPQEQDRTTQSYVVTPWDEDLDLFSAKVEWDADVGSLVAAVSQFERQVDFAFDSTPILLSFGVPVPAVTLQPQRREVTSAEVRWVSNLNNSVQFVVGGFYSDEDKSFRSMVIATDQSGRPLGSFEPGTTRTIFGRSKTDKLDQQALFGEVEWTIDDNLSVLGGLRYYRFEINSTNQELQPFGRAPSAFPQTFDVDDDQITVKGSATYRVSDDALVFLAISQGYRPGGTNDVAFIAPGQQPPPPGFGPDELINYELGWKLSLLDNQMTFNGSVFYIDWEDIQVSTFDPSSPFEVVRNNGEAEVAGIEFDLVAKPMPGLELSLVASWQKAEYASEIPGENASTPFARNGDPIPNVPDYQFGATIQYTLPTIGNANMLARLGYHYIDDRIILPNNPDADVPLDSFGLWDMRLAFQADRWSVAFFGKNLADEGNAVYDAINSGQDPRSLVTARPRTLGLQMQYSF